MLALSALLKEALTALQANRLRSLLTVLGVVIGVAAVIVMIGIGQGASQSIAAQMQRMGTNLLVVFAGATGGQVRGAGGAVNTLKAQDAQAIAQLPGVSGVAPEISTGATAAWGNQTWVTSVSGTTPDLCYVLNRQVESGRFFDEQDLRSLANVAVLGKTVAENLFPPGVDPVGQTVLLNRMAFRVIGVLAPVGATTMGRDADDIVYIPLTTAQTRLLGVDYVRLIYVRAATSADLSRLPDLITTLLRERHRLPPNAEDDFTIRNPTAIMEAAENTAKTMTVLLAAVAAVSLVVGGIGVMNIMLVSVTERVKEIGIRMAVGATEQMILWQFLLEAVLLSLTGGLIGIVLGVLGSYLLSALAGWPTVISPRAILLATSFAVLVGVFFGYYPARRAAALNPAEALRYE
ncbi:ABC transporter permease [Ammonifex thiophilus]|uniref:ABC transporter permease n=1 Tax=Ammonifex thiophilus TaxID=444093 RepID=A0A3D8P6E2_9THEO|nr:ABC transporter permease [Ammonifex thiophilus]